MFISAFLYHLRWYQKILSPSEIYLLPEWIGNIYKSNNHIGSVTDKAKKDSITGHHWTGWYGATAALTADYLLLYCYTPLHNLSWLRWLSVHAYWLWLFSSIHLQCRRNDKNHSPRTKVAGCLYQVFFTTSEKRLSVYGKKTRIMTSVTSPIW